MSNLNGTFLPEDHRKLGISLFNEVWRSMDKTNRSPEEDLRMLHAAHASRYHWGETEAEPVNLARGEWQISRVYAVLNRPEPSIYHAERSLEICLKNKIGDFDLAYAYEALTRGHQIAGNQVEQTNFRLLAEKAGNQIADPEDLKIFLEDLETIPQD